MNKILTNKQISYHPPEINHDLYIDVYTNIPEILNDFPKDKKHVLIVIDSNMPKQIVENVVKLFKNSNVSFEKLILPYGKKNLNRVAFIWKKMITYHPDLVIALGGGVICDLVAFSSSCYHRGVDHIFIPTTLLSAIDASVGGKTGIDFDGIKNSVGSIHYAKHVYIVLPFLKSVKKKELFSGLSEAIKAGMLFDKNVIDWLLKLKIDKFEASEQWLDIVFRCAQIKAKFTEKPMNERSRLLYGHNIGQAIETYSTKHIRHGDAVAMGIHLEGALGVLVGVMTKNAWAKQFEVIKKFNLPYKMPNYIEKGKLIEKMKKYKLYKNNKFQFVMPKEAGVIYEDNNGYYLQITERKFNDIYDNLIKMANSM